MNHWLYPANVKLYDAFSAFSQPYAYWPISTKVEVGDTVYLYLSAPHKQLGFVCVVQEVGLSADSVMDNAKQYIKKSPTAKSSSKEFMNLKVQKRVVLDKMSSLSFECLKANGLNDALMGPRKLDNNPTLFAYIKECLV